eukprot:TRINITY_DN1786_c1_g1_i1.p1 TRINITY_DN1786_c1_g1~~TRINITY_DN1786_c1_g1_i1.p1  ORF type:complete len:114 (+),score=57.66 TRINITY_DN1786_c1_g1_i1:139-480(+)
MRIIAAYLLAVLGGNNSPSVEDLKKIFVAAGVDFDEGKAQQLIGELKGKNVHEVMKLGSSKLATFGGGSRGGSTSSAPVTTTETKVETKVEAPKKEEKEEESASIGGLFGDDD